jgi:hypothetical protein
MLASNAGLMEPMETLAVGLARVLHGWPLVNGPGSLLQFKDTVVRSSFGGG